MDSTRDDLPHNDPSVPSTLQEAVQRIRALAAAAGGDGASEARAVNEAGEDSPRTAHLPRTTSPDKDARSAASRRGKRGKKGRREPRPHPGQSDKRLKRGSTEEDAPSCTCRKPESQRPQSHATAAKTLEEQMLGDGAKTRATTSGMGKEAAVLETNVPGLPLQRGAAEGHSRRGARGESRTEKRRHPEEGKTLRRKGHEEPRGDTPRKTPKAKRQPVKKPPGKKTTPTKEEHRRPEKKKKRKGGKSAGGRPEGTPRSKDGSRPRSRSEADSEIGSLAADHDCGGEGHMPAQREQGTLVALFSKGTEEGAPGDQSVEAFKTEEASHGCECEGGGGGTAGEEEASRDRVVENEGCQIDPDVLDPQSAERQAALSPITMVSLVQEHGDPVGSSQATDQVQVQEDAKPSDSEQMLQRSLNQSTSLLRAKLSEIRHVQMVTDSEMAEIERCQEDILALRQQVSQTRSARLQAEVDLKTARTDLINHRLSVAMLKAERAALREKVEAESRREQAAANENQRLRALLPPHASHSDSFLPPLSPTTSTRSQARPTAAPTTAALSLPVLLPGGHLQKSPTSLSPCPGRARCRSTQATSPSRSPSPFRQPLQPCSPTPHAASLRRRRQERAPVPGECGTSDGRTLGDSSLCSCCAVEQALKEDAEWEKSRQVEEKLWMEELEPKTQRAQNGVGDDTRAVKMTSDDQNNAATLTYTGSVEPTERVFRNGESKHPCIQTASGTACGANQEEEVLQLSESTVVKDSDLYPPGSKRLRDARRREGM